MYELRLISYYSEFALLLSIYPHFPNVRHQKVSTGIYLFFLNIPCKLHYLSSYFYKKLEHIQVTNSICCNLAFVKNKGGRLNDNRLLTSSYHQPFRYLPLPQI